MTIINKIKGIDLIINDLETSKYGFTRTLLHIRRGKKCYYCGEGLLMKKSDIPYICFSGLQTIEDVVESEIMLKKRYGFDFTKPYEFFIRCSLCNEFLEDFENVIVHLNDAHSRNHKQLAERLKDLSKKYNLKTGKLK